MNNEEEVQDKDEEILAPNDPQRVPKEHRELINTVFKILASSDLDIFEAQQIASVAVILCRNKDIPVAQATMNKIIDAIKVVPEAPTYVKAITELLNMKMTEAMNKTKVSDIRFEEV